VFQSPDDLVRQALEDARARRGDDPVEESPNSWLRDLTRDVPAAVPVVERVFREFLEDANAEVVNDGILGVEYVPTPRLWSALAQAALRGWPGPLGAELQRRAVDALAWRSGWVGSNRDTARKLLATLDGLGPSDEALALAMAIEPTDAWLERIRTRIAAGALDGGTFASLAATALVEHTAAFPRMAALAQGLPATQRRIVLDVLLPFGGPRRQWSDVELATLLGVSP
jgi:hypothetical protein